MEKNLLELTNEKLDKDIDKMFKNMLENDLTKDEVWVEYNIIKHLVRAKAFYSLAYEMEHNNPQIFSVLVGEKTFSEVFE